MAISNFIPTIWSENLYRQLDKQYVAVKNSSRDYEGDIKKMGSVVKICGVGAVDVADYTKNTDMSAPQTLSDTVANLEISQAKYFNFQIDDIDRAQATPKLMDEAMRVAAGALANAADAYVCSIFTESENKVEKAGVSVDNIIDTIIDAQTKLFSAGMIDTADVSVEVSPEIANLLLKAKLATATDNTAALEKGCLGQIGGCKVYVSSNIVKSGNVHNCVVRTKRAVAFAEQLSDIEAYRPEKRFADALKGLHLYGAKIVYPEELVLMKLTIGA